MNYDVAKVYANMRSMGTTDAEKLGWASAEIQQRNFTMMTDMLRELHVPLPGLTLHDAGCGTGDLLDFLQRTEQMPCEYFGTDFTEESLKIARERFPAADFFLADLMPRGYKSVLSLRADVTLCFGALAYHKPRDVEDILNALWNQTTVALGFQTWWDTNPRYLGAESIEQLRKCVNRFLRNKLTHQKLITTPEMADESMFVVLR